MTAIQIITINSKDKTIRGMIEKVNQNNFRLYISSKETYFTPFIVMEKEFKKATDALTEITNFFQNSIILEVDNQISDLLTTNEISTITKCSKIKES